MRQLIRSDLRAARWYHLEAWIRRTVRDKTDDKERGGLGKWHNQSHKSTSMYVLLHGFLLVLPWRLQKAQDPIITWFRPANPLPIW